MAWWRNMMLAVVCGSSAAVSAAEGQWQNGPQRSVMIELYTSEGCSSCPPAERFLNGLLKDKQLWQTYIPLAFHVDYWDYLGWRDRFANPFYSQRQQRYASVLHARTVYTPEFFINGQEWRRGFFSGLPAAAKDQVGVLTATLNKGQLHARFTPTHKTVMPLQWHVAVLGMDLVSDIRAGENAGRHSTHQFVVLAHMQETSDTLQWQTALPHANQQAQRKAVVVWLSATDNPAPLQATGGFIP
jgi:hypothetical protein